MMKIALLSLFALTLVLSSCTPYGASRSHPLPTPYGITRSSGAEQARRDLARGKLQLLEAGTEAVYTPALPFGESRFDHVPRYRLPVGCTTPHADQWVDYAEGYNAVVLEHIQKPTR